MTGRALRANSGAVAIPVLRALRGLVRYRGLLYSFTGRTERKRKQKPHAECAGMILYVAFCAGASVLMVLLSSRDAANAGTHAVTKLSRWPVRISSELHTKYLSLALIAPGGTAAGNQRGH